MKKIITAVVCMSALAAANARPIYPAEIVGRELNQKGLGWAGHVGITTTGMNDPSQMYNYAESEIEVLNEQPVGQINLISTFSRRSPYWGSRYGVSDFGVRGYRLLVEANHQRWWCPQYTYFAQYRPGQGIPTTGYIISCGVWRCDNFVWWVFLTQGYNLVPSGIFLPRDIFRAFPFQNDGRFLPDSQDKIEETRTLADVTPDEINSMGIERLQMIVDNPQQHLVEAPYAQHLKTAKDKRVKDVIRGGLLDVIALTFSDSEIPLKMIEMYKASESEEVRVKIVQNVMVFNQSHGGEDKYKKDSLPKVRAFFERLLHDKKLAMKISDNALRGYIDTHTSEEIIANKELVDAKLANLETHEQSIMLKSALMFKSKDLQAIYTKSAVDELRHENKSDLDSYLFGPLSLAYKEHLGFLSKDSENIVIDYLNEVQFKYTAMGILNDTEDFTRSTTAPYHAALSQALGVK